MFKQLSLVQTVERKKTLSLQVKVKSEKEEQSQKGVNLIKSDNTCIHAWMVPQGAESYPK
jgi:hypothetical protein